MYHEEPSHERDKGNDQRRGKTPREGLARRWSGPTAKPMLPGNEPLDGRLGLESMLLQRGKIEVRQPLPSVMINVFTKELFDILVKWDGLHPFLICTVRVNRPKKTDFRDLFVFCLDRYDSIVEPTRMEVPTLHPFSLEGLVKSFETAEDLQEHVERFNAMPQCDLVKLSGNTFGVAGCRAFADALAKRTDLIVPFLHALSLLPSPKN